MGAIQKHGKGQESETLERIQHLLFATIMGIQYKYASYLHPSQDA